MQSIDELTIKQAREIATLFTGGIAGSACAQGVSTIGPERAVVVCTEKRGVFFGYTHDVMADPISLRASRMCIYWSSKIGGVGGLAATGPVDAVSTGSGSRIAAECDAIHKGITAVFLATEGAASVWAAAPVYRG